jgi:hypothetical protein
VPSGPDFAGDWIRAEGWLWDASLASAACAAIVARAGSAVLA